MGEAVRRRIDALLDAAERGESSLVPSDEKGRKALLRRGLELVQPLAGQFVRRGTWRQLNPAERSLWLMRGLAARHPDWRFCEASAAVAYGLPVTWGLLTHVWVAAGRGSHDKSVPGVIRRCVSDPEGPALAQGLPVTSFWRTVFDCLVAFPPPDALAIADRALRLSQASARQVVDYLCSAHRGRRGVRGAVRVAALADARAESGGESIARWTMLEAGFEPPELQVWIEDPVEPGTWFRVDFLWLLPDGSVIIGEMTAGRRPSVPSSWVAAARYECCRTSACASLTSRRFAPRSCDLATMWRATPPFSARCSTRSAFRGNRATRRSRLRSRLGARS